MNILIVTLVAALRIPVGHAALDAGDLDRKIGFPFVTTVRNGANRCYTDDLRKDPSQQGEITFVVRPPQGEGRFLVALQRRGSIGDSLAACIDDVLGGFYHYRQNPAAERIEGTLRFEPRWISAPEPPSPEAARKALNRTYSPSSVVRIAKVTLKSVTEYSDPTSPAVYRRYDYGIDLVFRAAGYEADCHHYTPYKIFGWLPHVSPFAGHTCTNHRRKSGDRAVDRATVVFVLYHYPSVATSWKLME